MRASIIQITNQLTQFDQGFMGHISAILKTAQERSTQLGLSYTGALLPHEAYQLMLEAPAAKLIDVRSHAELDLIGTIPGAAQIEFMSYPGWHLNPHFTTHLKQQIDAEALLMFICRTGARSNKAAIAAMEAGFTNCYNVLQGFEGDKDPSTNQRGAMNGWQAAALPWQQG